MIHQSNSLYGWRWIRHTQDTVKQQRQRQRQTIILATEEMHLDRSIHPSIHQIHRQSNKGTINYGLNFLITVWFGLMWQNGCDNPLIQGRYKHYTRNTNEMVKGKRVFNYIEKRAEIFGYGAHVVLPKEYAGKIVKVEEIK